MAKLGLIVGCLGYFSLVGCSVGTSAKSSVTGVFAPLEEATAVEILVLDPMRVSGEPKGEEYFHYFKVLDRGSLDLGELPSLLNVLGKGVADNPGMAAGCFNPRHGVRLTLPNRTVDLVICRHSKQINEHDSTKSERVNHLTTEEPTATVNAMFRRAGLSPLERS